MKSIHFQILFLCFVLILLGCGTSANTSQTLPLAVSPNTPQTNSQRPTVTETPDYARTLVGMDRGQKTLVDVDDIDVKRTIYLFGVLTYQTKQPITEIAAGVDFASEQMANKFGRKVKRQQLLEDMANAYSKKLLGKGVEGQPFKDVVYLWAMMKYNK